MELRPTLPLPKLRLVRSYVRLLAAIFACKHFFPFGTAHSAKKHRLRRARFRALARASVLRVHFNARAESNDLLLFVAPSSCVVLRSMDIDSVPIVELM